MAKPLLDRIALVTGASRGIGAALALELAQAGAHVVAVARTVGGLEELDDKINAAGGSATLVPLDLKDSDGIARLALALNERYQRLDVLVGNAGILGSLSPLAHVQPKDWDNLVAVNITANWQLIRCMDALLQRSRAGRAVFLTSGVAHMGRAYWGLTRPQRRLWKCWCAPMRPNVRPHPSAPIYSRPARPALACMPAHSLALIR